MKKVLVIHNQYRNTGGEDIAVSNEISLLKKHYVVESLFFTNQKVKLLPTFFGFVISSNFKSNKILKKKLKKFKPDIVYVHNTWFNASLGIFKILKANKIKTIIKLHNFRYKCTNSFFSKVHMNGESLCYACGLQKKEMGLFNKYFLNSIAKSLLVNLYGKRYFKILEDPYFNIFVLTKFHKNFINQLIPNAKVKIFPNFITLQNHKSRKNIEEYFLYAGRISDEKGVSHLISSFLEAGLDRYKLKILGAGPELKTLIQEEHMNVEFLGVKTNQETLDLISKSLCVITGTKLWEGQPTLLCEASTFGVPSIFPNFGGMAEFFPDDYKLAFKQYDYEDLTSKIIQSTDVNFNKKTGLENKEHLNKLLDERNLIGIFGSYFDE